MVVFVFLFPPVSVFVFLFATVSVFVFLLIFEFATIFLLVQVCESSRVARWPSGWVGGLLPLGANCECLTGRIPETG